MLRSLLATWPVLMFLGLSCSKPYALSVIRLGNSSLARRDMTADRERKEISSDLAVLSPARSLVVRGGLEDIRENLAVTLSRSNPELERRPRGGGGFGFSPRSHAPKQRNSSRSGTRLRGNRRLAGPPPTRGSPCAHAATGAFPAVDRDGDTHTRTDRYKLASGGDAPRDPDEDETNFRRLAKGVSALCREETKVFLHESLPPCLGEPGGLVWFAVHSRLDHVHVWEQTSVKL